MRLLLCLFIFLLGCTQDAEDSEPSPKDSRAQIVGTQSTEASLQQFFSRYKSQNLEFPPVWEEVVSKGLLAEDHIVSGNFEAAKSLVSEVTAKYPFDDMGWNHSFRVHNTHAGRPAGYSTLRMVDEIASFALLNRGLNYETTEDALVMGIVIPQCSIGVQPTTLDFSESKGVPVELTIHPKIISNNFEAVRESLRLFQRYIWFVTNGKRRLDLKFLPISDCVDVDFGSSNRAGLKRYTQTLDKLPEDIQGRFDFWWIIYPSNVPQLETFQKAGKEVITGGMGMHRGKPVFVLDDLFLINNPFHLGSGERSSIERRAYFPQWLQHEFFHHLFRVYRNLNLESTSHQWFNKSLWPSDFNGRFECDYFTEAFNKRLRFAKPPLDLMLDKKLAQNDKLKSLKNSDITGSYLRIPVENKWHEVEITLDKGFLFWRNAAGKSWRLSKPVNGVLETDKNAPYPEQKLQVLPGKTLTKESSPEIAGLWFMGELYVRQ